MISLLLAASLANAQAPKKAPKKAVAETVPAATPPGAVRGRALFGRNCAFCHGKDADGGESGPDLTRSKLVARDIRGDKIRATIHDGRIEKGMPPFPRITPAELADLIAFIRDETKKAAANPGGRKGVDVADLQTGNADAGKTYFNAKCASCHSPTGDLAGIASRREGLELEMQMLYPQNAKSKATVTTPSGETVSGILAYKDEFNIGVVDGDGWYRSWPVSGVKYKIDAPQDGHVELFPNYTDNDIHDLMAYLQTLK
ncbi:MAG TPA: c-type cytochrome [Terriglobales bacterium]|nr:c-type cytochrome [Terriglobales bacterium]